jgi:glyoxylase-like metal-dependent hydrolase (beta-lactamase superfamily II)
MDINATLPPLNQSTSADNLEMIRPLYESAPNPGAAMEIATGLWWLRLPLLSTLNHINVYVLESKDGWTLVDTGSNTPICRTALETAFSQGALARLPLTHVIGTHYHPDHIGLAGWLVDRGAIFQTTRTCWLQSRLLQLDDHDLPRADELKFVQAAGMKGMELAAFQRRAPSDFSSLVTPVPPTYQRIQEGDILKIGDRQWTIHIGNGHAAEHATLWSDDGFVITGDQILPGMSSNISIHHSEPDADLVSEWIESCHRFARLATSQTVCLPGHNIPFRGIAIRCQQMIAAQEGALNRLLAHLNRPHTAIDCLEAVYHRQLQVHERNIAISETYGFLNHLYHRGLIDRELTNDLSYLWYRLNPRNRDFQICFYASKCLV